MNVTDDSEIDWKLLSDEGWNLWSPHILQKRWMNMKKSIVGHEDMPFHGKCSTCGKQENGLK
jgi:hypothetical protein